MSKQYYIIPVFVPHLGCPHQCVFCNQKEIVGTAEGPTPAWVKNTIQEYLATIPRRDGVKVEVAFYGGSFTAIPRLVQEGLLQPAFEYLQEGLIHNIRISTRPDCVDGEALEFLGRFGVRTIELGVQSMNPEVLALSGRGHTAEDVRQASRLIKDYGLTLGLQMMIGLPGDTKERAVATAGELICLEPDFVRIYPLLVVEGTPLAESYRLGRYRPLALEEAVETCADLLLVFTQAGIPVIRMGLQPSQEINYQGKVLAGPFHPAFGELVESKVAYRQVVSLLAQAEGEGIRVHGETILAVSPRDISILRGQKNSNLKALRHVYSLNLVEVIPDDTLARGEVKLIALGGKRLNIISRRID
ncbi:MAG: elongator complex protein 3 [Thermincolia bacterium]